MNDLKIAVGVMDGEIAVAPMGYLGAHFGAYLAACRSFGLTWVPTHKFSRMPADAETLQNFLRALEDAGFATVVDERVGALQAKAEAAKRAPPSNGEQVRPNSPAAKEGRKLLAFQPEAIRWLRSRRHALLGDDPGLGKTCELLLALPPNAAALVVGPAVAKGVWQAETRMWREDLEPVVLRGGGSFRWPKPGEVICTNYDILPLCGREIASAEAAVRQASASTRWKYEQELAELKAERARYLALGLPTEGTVLIADEAQNLCTATTRRTRRFRELRRAVLQQKGRVWGATGTPLMNHAGELWNVLESLELGKEAFESYPFFLALMGRRKGQWGKTAVKTVPAVARRLQRVMLRRLFEDVIDQVPPVLPSMKIETGPLDAETRRLCDELCDKLKANGIDLDGAIDLSTLTAAKSIAFEEISLVRAALATAKIPDMLEHVEEFEGLGEPLIVVSDHRPPVDLLGQREGWAAITGDVDPMERKRIEERMQAGELKGVAMTIKSGGVALTLTRARMMLWVDRAWNPAANRQCRDRIRRIGQTRGVQSRYLLAPHRLERRMDMILTDKQELITSTVDAAAIRQ
jgi:SNF2 family DNA or RNA helicase